MKQAGRIDEKIRQSTDLITSTDYLHDVHEAEDLMIEVFSYLFAKRPHIRDGGFRAYLYKAARHMLCAIKASGDITSVLMI